ncbi:MAG: ANTAR domain-containing protein [Acidimicrobiales bacterium]
MLESVTVDSVLELVTGLAITVLPAVEGVKASRAPAGSGAAEVASHGVLHHEGRRGPGAEALASGLRQNVDLESARDRWPEFVDAARAQGFRSVLALPLRAGPLSVGALELYARCEAAFGAGEVAVAAALADQAAVTLANAIVVARAQRARTDMEDGMTTRGLIGQAQGILMVRHACDGVAAFAMLRRSSQATNRKLREVVGDLVADHERGVGWE